MILFKPWTTELQTEISFSYNQLVMYTMIANPLSIQLQNCSRSRSRSRNPTQFLETQQLLFDKLVYLSLLLGRLVQKKI